MNFILDEISVSEIRAVLPRWRMTNKCDYYVRLLPRALLTAGLGSSRLWGSAAESEYRVDCMPWSWLLRRWGFNLQPAKQHPGRDQVGRARIAAVCLHCLPETATKLPLCSPSSVKKDLGLAVQTACLLATEFPIIPPHCILRILDRAELAKRGVTSSSEQPITVNLLTPLPCLQSTDNPRLLLLQ
jgi:hypothetical protein